MMNHTGTYFAIPTEEKEGAGGRAGTNKGSGIHINTRSSVV